MGFKEEIGKQISNKILRRYVMSKHLAMNYVDYISKAEFKNIFDNKSWSILKRLDNELMEEYLIEDSSLFSDVYKFLVKNGVGDVVTCREDESYIMNLCGKVIGHKFDNDTGSSLLDILGRSTKYNCTGELSLELAQRESNMFGVSA